MNIYIIYILIILVTIILYFLVKDKKEFMKKIGITTIVTGVILLILGVISNISLDTFLNNFNITRITALLLREFIYSSIFLLVVGLIEVFISKLINKKKITSYTDKDIIH